MLVLSTVVAARFGFDAAAPSIPAMTAVTVEAANLFTAAISVAMEAPEAIVGVASWVILSLQFHRRRNLAIGTPQHDIRLTPQRRISGRGVDGACLVLNPRDRVRSEERR